MKNQLTARRTAFADLRIMARITASTVASTIAYTVNCRVHPMPERTFSLKRYIQTVGQSKFGFVTMP
jgi:hypothetical protein